LRKRKHLSTASSYKGSELRAVHYSSPASPEFKLKIELVPKSLWGMNLRARTNLGKSRWTKLRKRILIESGPSCVICGSVEGPHGHEIWEYREHGRLATAKLLGVEIICRQCHFVHHLGRALQLLEKEAIETLIAHFMTVNECTRKDFDRHFESCVRQFNKRNKKRWRIDWGEFADIVQECSGRA
jgi:hypothetical protein